MELEANCQIAFLLPILLVTFVNRTVAISDYVERAVAYFVINKRGHDDDLFTRQPEFKDIKPTIDVTCSISSEMMPKEYTDIPEGNLFPPINVSHSFASQTLQFMSSYHINSTAQKWTNPPGTKEVLLVVQDADVPIPYAVCHGIYYHIPPTISSIEPSYFANTNPTCGEHGIKIGKNLYGNSYIPVHPLMNHGPHRYFYQVIALNRPLEGLKDKAKYDEILKMVKKEDVVAWGEWVGKAERKM